ncbi:MAG: hypothetical protein AAFU71_07765 [Cyanobacteria bacterium J06632_22]
MAASASEGIVHRDSSEGQPSAINHQSITRYLRHYGQQASSLTQQHLTTGHLFSASVLNHHISAGEVPQKPVYP